MHSPVEDHDLVPSLPDNLKSQTHCRVSECDGRPSVQVEPSPINRIVTVSAGVQTDLSQVVHSSCRSFATRLNHKVPLHVPPVPDQNAWDINWSGLTAYASLPPGDPKSGNPIANHCNSPRLARHALVLGPSGALNRDPTSTSSVKNSSQTVPQLCVPQQSTASQPPRLVSRSGQL